VNETLGAEQIEMREVDIGITDGIHTVLRTDIGALKVVTEETDEGAQGARGRRPF
jgi:HlyD family secretion protein